MVNNEEREKESSKEDQSESTDLDEKIVGAEDTSIGESLAEDDDGAGNEMDELTEERDQLKDQLLRAMAETENIRRRTEREMQSAKKYGHTAFARDLVGAIDNLARAIEATDKGESADALQSLVKGIELSWTEIQTVIEKHGIKRIDPVGEKFDYNLHQAMFEMPTDEHEAGIVVEVVQHGYVLHDRLLRPAMVGVSKALDSSGKDIDAQA